MKKKIIALIMSIVLCVSLAVPAFAAEEDAGFDINSILSSEIFQELLNSEGMVDITNIVLELVVTMNPENIQAMGQEKAQQFIQSIVREIGAQISLLVGNKDLIITYDPIKVFGNLFGFDPDSLTTQNPENTPEHPDELVIGMGDVDGDGKISAADARQILRRAAKLINFTMEQDALADVDGDGKVTAMDARTVLRVSAGLESFDVEE